MKKDQEPSAILERYQRAARFYRGAGTKDLAINTVLLPTWIGETNSFWYVREGRETEEYRLVDAAAKTNEPLFDHEALAAALEKAVGETVDPQNLPLKEVEIALAPLIVTFNAFGKRWRFEAEANACQEVELIGAQEVVSPDGKWLALRRDHNIWLRDRNTGEERALTSGGEEDNSYAATDSSWGDFEIPGKAQLRWSPDSRRIFTLQRDKRAVKTIPVVNFAPGGGVSRPTARMVKLALPGDEAVEQLRLVVLDVASGEERPVQYAPLPSTHLAWRFFDNRFGWWSRDSRHAYFIDVDRYYKWARVMALDTDSGACRLLFEETTDTRIKLATDDEAGPAHLPLPETDELLWYSERTGAAHFYLYDLKTGALKNPVTSGPGLVRNLIEYVPARRELFVQRSGRVKGWDAYHRDVARVNIDTGDMVEIAASDHEYVCMAQPDEITASILNMYLGRSACPRGVSPTGEYVVVTRSRADEAPESYVLDRDGARVMELETADMFGMPEGWRWPELVRLTAADEKTDLFGLVCRPPDFDPQAFYPVLWMSFNTPETSVVPKGAFACCGLMWRYYLIALALAELGFVVVQLDGRGTPNREKAFTDARYGRVNDYSAMEDHVAGLRQLAEKYPFMDMARVGIASITSGGPGAVNGMLRHPDLFKVGVTINHHDHRLMAANKWANNYQGPDAEIGYYTSEDFERLEGKLLIMHGMQGPFMAPGGTLQLIDGFQKANRDVDLLLFPGGGADANHYRTRRAWDYLVRHLQDIEPPKNFQI